MTSDEITSSGAWFTIRVHVFKRDGKQSDTEGGRD